MRQRHGGISGMRVISRRGSSRRRVVYRLFFFMTLIVLYFIVVTLWSVQSTAPLAESGMSDMSVRLMHQAKFFNHAILLIQMDLEKDGHLSTELLGDATSRNEIFHQVKLRCALLQARTTMQCVRMLTSLLEKKKILHVEEKVDALIYFPLEMRDALHRCQGHRRAVNRTESFLSGSSFSIIDSIPRQVQRMKQKAEEYGLRFPSSSKLMSAAMHSDDVKMFMNGYEKWCDNVVLPRDSAVLESFTADAATTTTMDVQVLSASYIQYLLRDSQNMQNGLASIVQASTVSFFLLDFAQHPLEGHVAKISGMAKMDSSSFIENLKTALTKSSCKDSSILSIETDTKDFPKGSVAVKTRCLKEHAEHRIPHTQFEDWFVVPAEDIENKMHGNAQLKPLICEHLSEPLVLSRVIKYGTKTAIFAASWRGNNAIVKILHPFQYFSFGGFRVFMENSRLRTPLIHYPLFSCYSTKYDAIFQVQDFLDGYNTLQSAVDHVDSKERLTWKNGVEIAFQIACIFKFLHEHQAGGFFVFDDNHPSQYMIKKDSLGSYQVRLIDIDTLQLGHLGTNLDERRIRFPYSNISTRCRCFYCNGRSNCLFFNTPEAYEACGQMDEQKAWKLEMPHLVRPNTYCDGSSDVWFEAQLFYLIFGKKAAWKGKKREDLLDLLKLEAAPPLNKQTAKEEGQKGNQTDIWNALHALLSYMIRSRPTETDVLQRLSTICDRVGCDRKECPAFIRSADSGNYTSPLFLRME